MNQIFKVIIFINIFINIVYGIRIIEFSGCTWYVKSGYGGPGPNYWSDSEENVWLDPNGWLHLKIRYKDGIWYCSEVYTTEFTRYGIHRFYVISRLDSLDRNVVLGLFIYANDTTEVDIEFSKWGQIIPTHNAQYVVQPWYYPGNVEKFWVILTGTYTTHYFNWQKDSIRFKSIHGHYPEPPNSNYLIHKWLYTGSNNPLESESLRVHINLWLYQGNPPTNAQEVEVIIKNLDLPLNKILELYPKNKNRNKRLKFIYLNNKDYKKLRDILDEKVIFYDISGRKINKNLLGYKGIYFIKNNKD
jgi:hypothetical protein